MPRIKKHSHVPHSAEQMYQLVNDINAYPEFLPWCHSARVISHSEQQMTASLSMALGKLKQTLTTKNTLQPDREIAMQLLNGPFKHLAGAWRFQPRDEHSCEVLLEMDFEFKNGLLQTIFGKLFYQIMDSLVETFTSRANELYAGKQH